MAKRTTEKADKDNEQKYSATFRVLQKQVNSLHMRNAWS